MMTDGFHKPGFKLHALILQNLFSIAESDQLSAPLWDANALGPGAHRNNAAFVKEHVSKLRRRPSRTWAPRRARFWSRACSTTKPT